MPQIPVNSARIINFGYSVNIDLYNRSMTFETGVLTTYETGGAAAVLGIAFSLVDSVGLELMSVDWDTPQIDPNVSTSYELDLTSSPINFLFQSYTIIGYIKDSDGTVYQTLPIIKKVCSPKDINESGYVPGDFEIVPDCINNSLTVKEFTLLVYDNKTPFLVTKSGTLSYPTGTISAVSFTGTPFSNNNVYTGSYRINCTTVATYDMEDDVYVLVTYLTNEPFPVTCSNFIGDITCCLTDVYNTYLKNCENAKGQAALQKYNSVLPSILNGLVKQINGQDASTEVAEIKKTLNCDCGATSIKQNEQTPTNPSVYSIVLNGAGGTTIPSPTINGNTKTYSIASKTYIVSKGNTGDLAYTITQDTSVTNVVRYKITFNYDLQALYNLNAIAASPTLLNQLNSLITATGASITGLDGKCVIDLTEANYSVSQAVSGSTLITNIVINGTNYAAPSNLFANNGTTVAAWLNSLSKGTFTAVVASGTLTIQSVSNANIISTITFTTPNIVKQFSSTNATLVQVLQAVVDYVCGLTSLQVALSNQLSLCTFDYNGNIVTTPYAASSTQQGFNAGVASAICNITARINTLTGVTCSNLKAIFVDRAGEIFGANDRLFGTLNEACSGLTDLQIAQLVVSAVGKYAAIKTAWCAIDCSSPATCPDISDINKGMVGSSIGIYGLTWASSTLATQTVTVRYRASGSLTWIVATNELHIFPNGNISGTSPFLISSGITPGTTYSIWLTNNCGGNGFVTQITTPTGSVYTGSYLLENVLYDICGATPVTLYSSAPFGSGVTMYSNIGLTTIVTGYTYITTSGSNIFGLNTSTGVVGTDTGTACTSGTAGTYYLGNSTGTVCAASPTTLYTNGAFAVGQVLYTDAALTTPQTGYSYVVYGHTIYNVNSGNGTVGASTGLSCLSPGGTDGTISSENGCSSTNSITEVRFNGEVASVDGGGYPIIANQSRTITVTNAALAGTLAIDIGSHVGGTDSRLIVTDSNSAEYCQPISANGTYTFSFFDIIDSVTFDISIECGGVCS